MEDSLSSASAFSNRVTTPPPLTPYRRPTPGKRMHYGPNKRDAIEKKLLNISTSYFLVTHIIVLLSL